MLHGVSHMLPHNISYTFKPQDETKAVLKSMRGIESTNMGDKDKTFSIYSSLYYFEDMCLNKQQKTQDTKRCTTTAQVRATQLTAERCLHDTRAGFTDTKLVPISFSHHSSLLKTLGEASEVHNNA
jgi:hypothetical protein